VIIFKDGIHFTAKEKLGKMPKICNGFSFNTSAYLLHKLKNKSIIKESSCPRRLITPNFNLCDGVGFITDTIFYKE